MRRSVRCRHGFCLETVGCPTCRVDVPETAGAHLRRAGVRGSRRERVSNPSSYRNQGEVRNWRRAKESA